MLFLPYAVPMFISIPIFHGLFNEDLGEITVAIGSRLFLFNQRYLRGDFAATAILAGLPLTVLFLVAQRWLVSGMRSGAVKG